MCVTLVHTIRQLPVLIALPGHMETRMAQPLVLTACLEPLHDPLERQNVPYVMLAPTVSVLAPLFVLTALLDLIPMCLHQHSAIPALLVRIRALLLPLIT